MGLRYPTTFFTPVCIACILILHGSTVFARNSALHGHAANRRLAQDAFTPGELMALHLPAHPDLTWQEPTGEYSAVCIEVKNAHAKLREWLLYHRWLGIGKVYLYDHESEPALLDFVEDMVKEGFVEYQYFSGHHHDSGYFIQSATGYAYNDCLLRNRMKHRWMGFLQVHEFLVLYQQGITNATTFLQQYEGYGGLGLNWLTFAGSGDQDEPIAGALLTYTRCPAAFSTLNQRVKLFVNPRYTLGFYHSPHVVSFTLQNMTVVSDTFQEVHGGTTSTPSYTRAALHQYPCSTEHACDAAMAALLPSASAVVGLEGTGRCTRGVEVGGKFMEATGANLRWRQFPRTDLPSMLPHMIVYANK